MLSSLAVEFKNIDKAKEEPKDFPNHPEEGGAEERKLEGEMDKINVCKGSRPASRAEIKKDREGRKYQLEARVAKIP